MGRRQERGSQKTYPEAHVATRPRRRVACGGTSGPSQAGCTPDRKAIRGVSFSRALPSTRLAVLTCGGHVMIQKRALVLSCLAWCSFPSIVLADEVTSPAPQNSRGASLAKGQSDHIASLEDVVVTARRVPGLSVNAEEMPAHATVITEEQIARS